MARETTHPVSRRRLWYALAAGLILLSTIAACFFWLYRGKTPGAKAAKVATQLCEALRQQDGPGLSRLVVTPSLLISKTAPEIERELMALLSDEISADGLEALRSKGTFGSLREIFPEEAAAWAGIFAVNANDCVAFRAERDGLRAELVLLKRGNDFMVLRCNNVQQMAP